MNIEEIKNRQNAELEKIKKDTLEFHKEYNSIIREWRKYLYYLVLFLGGALSIFFTIVSSSFLNKKIDQSDFALSLKILLLSIALNIIAITYSIYKEREIMWGKILIKGFDFGEKEYEKYTLHYKFKKFCWVLFPDKFPEMDELNDELREDLEKNLNLKEECIHSFSD
ncbi:MAG: hypothetical protein COZ28_03295 [Candidatus Moranbacteria bacterium CG_4_10_14_3_um_filter_44_15]|nr:MAG: hypothetical protein COS72_02135 [Candidatus Moranbacteria bacterium CG06_land_8_20_14_3_00_43_56]PIV83447.1 MAG: hypothetical protein COW51_04430 [Candidatus Moranbacteria bacterium CG17_big_fil_post_rev_8_21_14_2_50_44_12]PIW93399.1 MAG: hypothetical protein COZ87_01740 [Candidatus Moranbacteria bacterium CG_4_8_14_3_um_filter_43_15]PIX90506.1 MAG: hypothetical protein COZ28_03295 [Candidatus Moranbacteria bacterium CG_4_10_14_3_um_filter_44_15]PJA86334.1 MAG: hypothetical protein CO1